MLTALAACTLAFEHPDDAIRLIEVPSPGPAQSVSDAGHEWTLGPFDPGFDWDELVPSWNVENGDKVSFRIQAGLSKSGSAPDRWYNFGVWSLAPSKPRMSAKGIKDATAEVQTDTLVATVPQRKVWIKIGLSGPEPKFPFVALSFRNSKAKPVVEAGLKKVWGKTIDLPTRAQMDYENGGVLCSPTCISMLMWHWSKVLERPEMNHDVPVVAAGVFDPNWPGTGNWPFNTAYVGAVSGMRGYVARLGSVREIEEWIAADVPIVTSVSYAMLKGKPEKAPNDGHLVIVVGFDKEGNPVFNDPGRSDVRQTYKREDFERAWASSGNTVYIVHPIKQETPDNFRSHWLD